MNVSMVTEPDHSLVSVDGALDTLSAGAVMDMVLLVPESRPMVVDLRGVTRIEGRAAAGLSYALSVRSARAHVAVICADVDVTVRLVLAGIDPRVAFVATLEDAVGLVTGVVVRA